MKVTEELLKELEQKAKAATPGPWYDCRPTKSIRVKFESPAFQRGDFVIARYPTRTNKSLVSHEEWEANAKLISKCHPQVILALIERIRGLEAQNRVRETLGSPYKSYSDASASTAGKNVLTIEKIEEAIHLLTPNKCCGSIPGVSGGGCGQCQ